MRKTIIFLIAQFVFFLCCTLSINAQEVNPGGSGFGFGSILFSIIVIAFALFLFVTVYQLATKSGRNGIGWLLLSFVVSPILVLIILLIMGETADNKKNKMLGED